jgi:uncharacterized protein (TIGR02391 family)
MGKMYPLLETPVVWAVARALTDSDGGLTNSDIDRVFSSFSAARPPAGTKRDRVASALLDQQGRDGKGNVVIRFLTEAMNPAWYTADRARFFRLQGAVNEPLVLAGYRINDQGKVASAGVATTLDEVALLACRLRSAMIGRGAHAEVIRYCEREVVEQNPFHAMQESVKGVAERLRAATGFGSDGASLVDACFSGNPAHIQLTAQQTDSERSVQTGFGNLLKGLFGHFRNPTAHAARVTWPVAEQDVLDLFSMLSYVHRRLDAAEVPPSP